MRNVGNQEKKREARNMVVRREHTTGAIYHPEIWLKALFVNNKVTITTSDVSLKIMYPVYPFFMYFFNPYIHFSSCLVFFLLTSEATLILHVSLATSGLRRQLRERTWAFIPSLIHWVTRTWWGCYHKDNYVRDIRLVNKLDSRWKRLTRCSC